MFLYHYSPGHPVYFDFFLSNIKYNIYIYIILKYRKTVRNTQKFIDFILLYYQYIINFLFFYEYSIYDMNANSRNLRIGI